MKIHIIICRNQLACGSPKFGEEEKVMQLYYYVCQAVTDDFDARAYQPNDDYNGYSYCYNFVMGFNDVPDSKNFLEQLAAAATKQNRILSLLELTNIAIKLTKNRSPYSLPNLTFAKEFAQKEPAEESHHQSPTKRINPH